MQTHYYLGLIPESLVASMLPPEEFGAYMAVGTKKRSRGQASFFELDPELLPESFPLEQVAKRCVPHADGSPKRSVYLSIYRVLERVPLQALKRLYLVTGDGRVLGLEPTEFTPDPNVRFNLYQELLPVHPRVVSLLNPAEFAKFMTAPESNVSVPRIMFCDLQLGELHRDPDTTAVQDLPYTNIGHLRDCLRELHAEGDIKQTKTMDRRVKEKLLYRTVSTGFFVGDQEGLRLFSMPNAARLEREYYEWWRSAQAEFAS